MTRSDLIKTIAEKVDGVTQEKAKEIVAVTLDSIADALTAGCTHPSKIREYSFLFSNRHTANLKHLLYLLILFLL